MYRLNFTIPTVVAVSRCEFDIPSMKLHVKERGEKKTSVARPCGCWSVALTSDEIAAQSTLTVWYEFHFRTIGTVG